MMDKVMYKELNYRMRTSDFDFNDYMKPSAILDYFQEIAGIHASELKLGFDEMIAKSQVWVLMRSRFTIIKSPKQNDEIIVATWPRKKGRIDFDRDYLIMNPQHEVLIKGSSKWVVINKGTRRIVRTEQVEYLGQYYDKQTYQENLEKLSFDFEKIEPSYSYLVQNDDLDHNGHMNNIRYATVIFNMLDVKIHYKIKDFEINYITEAKMGDTILVYHAKKEKYDYFYGKINDKDCFIARIEGVSLNE